MSTHAVVRIAALDVRRKPSHRSELRSQLLMGELVRVRTVGRGGNWSRVESRSDGYRGWVRAWGLLTLTAEEAGEWERAARWRMARSHVELRSGPGRGAVVGPVFWNSPVVAAEFSRGFVRLRLPDGTQGWTERRNIRLAERKAGSLEQVIGGFFGVPYLWGGRTPLGFDCSGFVQQVLAGVGTVVPRDAHEQFEACRRPGRKDAPRKGELLFFGPSGRRMAHVGISLGGGLYAHAQGTVHLNSLMPSNPLYDSNLASALRAVRRP